MNIPIDIWSRLLIAACMLQTACDDELGELEEPDLEAVEPRSVSTVSSSTSDEHPLSWASGTKVVVASSGIHAVYHDVGYIKYTTSTNGINWTFPPALAGGANNSAAAASQPTIAVAGDGTIGVAYRKNQGEIRYMFKPPNGTWFPSFKITADASSGPGGVVEPSIVAFGNTMHLTWSKSSSVYYASFPATQSTPLATAERVDHDAACGGSAANNHPAIAISGHSAVDPTARVRVAFFDRGNNCPDDFFAITVAERQSNGSWQYVREQTFPAAESWSISHAAIPATGDFYVAVSYQQGSVGKTEIWYENAWSNDTWRSAAVFDEMSYVDISAKIVGCVPTLRYALNYPFGAPGPQLGSSYGGYGQTFYRTGRWTGAQAAAPTWSDPNPILIDTDGSTPEALFFRKSDGNNIRDVPVVYARWIPGGGKTIAEATTTVPEDPSLDVLQQVPCKKNF